MSTSTLDRVQDDPQPSLTFERLHRLTPALSGPERLRLFWELPAQLQRAAWRSLRGRVGLELYEQGIGGLDRPNLDAAERLAERPSRPRGPRAPRRFPTF